MFDFGEVQPLQRQILQFRENTRVCGSTPGRLCWRIVSAVASLLPPIPAAPRIGDLWGSEGSHEAACPGPNDLQRGEFRTMFKDFDPIQGAESADRQKLEV